MWAADDQLNNTFLPQSQTFLIPLILMLMYTETEIPSWSKKKSRKKNNSVFLNIADLQIDLSVATVLLGMGLPIWPCAPVAPVTTGSSPYHLKFTSCILLTLLVGILSFQSIHSYSPFWLSLCCVCQTHIRPNVIVKPYSRSPPFPTCRWSLSWKPILLSHQATCVFVCVLVAPQMI